MTNEISYTVEVYKTDKRKKSGERLAHKNDYKTAHRDILEKTMKESWKKSAGYRFEIHETYVTRRNALNGNEIQERYDTPYYCSASSESYWSM
jgi:hypothetical protein